MGEYDRLIREVTTLKGKVDALIARPRWAHYLSASAPTLGTWRQGDVVWNNAPDVGDPIGWVCVVAGSPGTWQGFGNNRHSAMFTMEGVLTTGQKTLRIYNLTEDRAILQVHLAVAVAPVGSAITVDIHLDGTTIFTTQSNRPVIADGQYTGSSSVIEVSAWPVGGYLTFGVDTVGSGTPGSDLSVQVISA